jgi:hypothetical protein
MFEHPRGLFSVYTDVISMTGGAALFFQVLVKAGGFGFLDTDFLDFMTDNALTAAWTKQECMALVAIPFGFFMPLN